MKNLKELKGVNVLTKSEQKVITGGIIVSCTKGVSTKCPPGMHCYPGEKMCRYGILG